MRTTYPEALRFTLQWEGGWSDHPADPGGATMRGVTIGRYGEFLGRDVTKEELRAIPDDHVEAIYHQGYWQPLRCDHLPKGLDMAVFDFGVNSGPKRAAQYLQRLVGATDDGVIGPRTLDALEIEHGRVGGKELVLRYNRARRDYVRRLKTFKVFGPGWINRIDALTLVAGGLADP